MAPRFRLGRSASLSPLGRATTTAPGSRHILLSYNTILAYPALAKFMAVTHHGYNVLKMPGSGGVITVPCEERDAVCSLERDFQAASLEDPDCGSGRLPETAPKKKKTSPGPTPEEAGPSASAPAQGAPPSVA